MGKRESGARGRVLLIDDDRAIRQALGVELGHGGFELRAAETGEQGLDDLGAGDFETVLLDIRLPGRSGEEILKEIAAKHPAVTVVMLTAHGDVESAVRCLKEGAFDYLQKPTSLDELEATLDRAIEHTRLRSQNRELSRRLSQPEAGGERLIGSSPAMIEVRRIVERVAPTDVPVLIMGESGTGKEVVARQIVQQSPRAERPLFTLNCAALTETLVASELFGHERGAFTGASEARPGFFELADGGTVFLDEIGEMPIGLQAKLLRVIQFGEFQRVGGRRTLQADVRIIAATNRDLEAEIRESRFREDLYHRISTLTLHIPPLRERPGDIGEMLTFLLTERLPEGIHAPKLSDEARSLLLRHAWPGNVREMENVLTRAAILCDGGVIQPHDLPASFRAAEGEEPPMPAAMSDAPLDEVERQHILAMLARCEGNKAEAARRLGITKRTLYNKLILYGEHRPASGD